MTHRTRRLGLALGALLSIPAAAAAIGPDTTVLVSLPSETTTAPPDGVNSAVITDPRATSSDGRHVVFVSSSDDLAPGTADNASAHCFVRDMSTGVTTLLDAVPGGGPAGVSCQDVTISGDGTAVAFTTPADLVPDDSNNRADVYVRDLATGSLVRMSVGADGGQLSDGGSLPSVAAVGVPLSAIRRINVAFVTTTAIDPADTPGTLDVYVRRTATRFFPAATVLASRAPGPDGTALGNVGLVTSISENGDRVAFITPTSLDPADTNASSDAYVRSTFDATTQLASRAPGGAGAVQNGTVTTTILSRDGSTVAFESSATNLGGGPGPTQVYTRTLGSGATQLASVGDTGPADASATLAGVSDDGAVVGFLSAATNLGAGNPGRQAYVRRLVAPASTTLASRADGAGAAGRFVSDAAVSGDGTAAVFAASGGEFAPGVRSIAQQVFLRTLTSLRTRLVSRAGPDGPSFEQGTAGSSIARTGGRNASRGGRYVVFSSASPLVPGAGPQGMQVYRRDMLTGTIRLLSRAADGAAGDGASEDPVVNADGSVVAFTTVAPNLGVSTRHAQVAVWQASTDRVVLASVGPDGAIADRFTDAPGLSGDGTKVAFESRASNLGVATAPNTSHVWVRDVVAGTTILASRADGPAGAPLASGAGDPSISADGTRVAFVTQSVDTGNGDTGTSPDVHVRDLGTGRTIWASRADGPDGPGNVGARRSSLNADGTIVAFEASGNGLTPEDADGPWNDVFTRNLLTGRTVLQSRADGPAGAGGDGHSNRPVISDDGTRVAFTSSAANLTRDDINNVDDVFVRVASTGTTIGVSRISGATGTLLGGFGGSSPDLLCVPFTSTAPALVADGYRSPDFSQVYLRSVGAPCAAIAEPAPGPGGPGATARVTLSAVSLRPNRFRAGTRRGRGSTLRFTLTGAARVTAVVQRPRAGRIAAGTCRIGRRTGRKCTVWTRVARFTVQAPTGTTTRRFTAVFNRRALAPGRYRLRLTPTGGTTRTITFRVLKG